MSFLSVVAQKMEDKNRQQINESQSLLVLHDYCLFDIFERLTFVDYANLAGTCHRLRNLARNLHSPNHKRITIEATLKRDTVNTTISKQELSKVLAVIGEQVLEVTVDYESDVTLGLKSLKKKCKNLESITVSGYFAERKIRCFGNLKRLAVINGGYISLQEWKNFFASSPALEELNYYENDDDYEDGFMEILTHLPKLQSLGLPWIFDSLHQSPDFHHLLQLTGVKKLSLRSTDNLNGILVDLANNLNLVELDIHMTFDGESLGIIKSFQNLEVLSIRSMGGWDEAWFSTVLVFPPKLQRLSFDHMKMSCSKFLELLQHLTFLTEFELLGHIFWDDRSELFYLNCILTGCVMFTFIYLLFQLLISKIHRRWLSKQ